MPYTRNAEYRYISNSRIASRTNQFLVLIAAIIIGMIISASVNAISSSPKPSVADNTVKTSIDNKH